MSKVKALIQLGSMLYGLRVVDHNKVLTGSRTSLGLRNPSEFIPSGLGQKREPLSSDLHRALPKRPIPDFDFLKWVLCFQKGFDHGY